MLDGILGTSPSQPQVPRWSGAEALRRPCPMCGEPMIVAAAAKCRFCGAVFDPRLTGLSSMPGGQNYQGFAVTSMVLGIVSILTGCSARLGNRGHRFLVTRQEWHEEVGNYDGKEWPRRAWSWAFWP